MSGSTHTEDEFKKILRTLFAEKKRVKELQKQLDGKGLYKKFQTQPSDTQRISVSEEYAKLKNAYLEKENECAALQGQLEKVKPALRKLVTDLKEAREQLEMLKPHEATLKEKEHLLREAQETIAVLETEKKTFLEQQFQNHSEEVAFLHKQLQAALQVNEELKQTMSGLEEAREQILEKSYTKMRELSHKHALMVEQYQRIQIQLDEKNDRLSKSEKEVRSLEVSLQNVKLQSENRGREIRKAQQHLAKKVKETTILRDLTERHKLQIEDLNAALEKLRTDREQLQHYLDLQKSHEDKVHGLAKDRADAAEQLTKEWQEKFLALQQDWQEKKSELLELKKLRKNYDQMASTFSNLKNLVGKINATEASGLSEETFENHLGH